MNPGVGLDLLGLARLAYISENWEKLKIKQKTTRDIAVMVERGSRLLEIIGEFINSDEIDEIEGFRVVLEKAIKLGVVPVPMDDDEYPRLLRGYGYGYKVYPPLVLYRFGEPLNLVDKAVAVVGTRKPSDKGWDTAYELSMRLAKEGYVVVTGLAKGIDEAAAKGAMEVGGHVVGVLPWLYDDAGLTRFISNARKVIDYQRFTLVSEHLIKNEGLARQWLAMRNRIVSGMSMLIVIPEARYRNSGWGTRHQVEYGIRAGRKVLIIKPMVNDEDINRAYNYFIREGAESVESIDEVLDKVRQVQDNLSKIGKDKQSLDYWL